MLNATFRPSADMFSEIGRLQGLLDQVFRPAERSPIRALAKGSFPVINVGNTPEAIEVMALLPGVDAASLQLTIERGVLTIAGERAAPDPQGAVTVYAQERYAGPFRRVINLPDDADPSRVNATHRDGMLRVTVSKRESSRPRQIQIA